MAGPLLDPLLDAWLDWAHGSACVGCGRPGRALCSPCEESLPVHAAPARPTPCPPGLASCFATAEYADTVRALVLAHKEQGVFSLARPLGRLLARAVQAATDPVAPVVLVPVPSSGPVVRARGHDPLLRLTRVAARRVPGRPVGVHRLLRSSGALRDQSGLDTGDRMRNLAHTMHVDPVVRRVLAGAGGAVQVLVCDDVLTTGATAREAQRALEDSGITVRAVATVAATRKRLPPPDRSRGHREGSAVPTAFGEGPLASS